MLTMWESIKIGDGGTLSSGKVTHQAYKFTSDSNYRFMGETDLGDEFTFAFWIKVTTYNHQGEIAAFEYTSGTDHIRIVTINSPYKAIGLVYTQSSKQNTYFYPTSSTDWTHYIFVCYKNGRIRIFKNGIRVLGYTVTYNSISNHSSDIEFSTYKRKKNYIGRKLRAYLDEFRVYEGLLDSDTISCLQNYCSRNCNTCAG